MAEEELMDEASSSQLRPSGCKLFLGGLSWDTTEEKLREHFGKYGEIVEAVVMRDRQTGRPRGFGFVTFTAPEAADAVVQELHVIDGRQIDAKKSVPQEMKPKARKIFVGGLAPDTDEDNFREYFGQYGEIVEAQIMQDHMSGRSRGFGFITFAADSSAEAVFSAGAMHELGGKRVEVKPATPKGSGSLSQRPQLPRMGPTPPGRPGQFGGRGSPGPYPQMPAGPYAFGGMYGFPPGVVAPGFGMQYPYMMMQQVGGFPAPQAAFGFPLQAGQPAAAYGSSRAQQQIAGGGLPAPSTGVGRPPPPQQLPQLGPPPPQLPYPRPLPGGRGGAGPSGSGAGRGGKVDSASSLDLQQAQQQLKKMSLE